MPRSMFARPAAGNWKYSFRPAPCMTRESDREEGKSKPQHRMAQELHARAQASSYSDAVRQAEQEDKDKDKITIPDPEPFSTRF